ncbi:hypothetical protein Nepgr_013868 [Nepenthes gracilis]|uniref:C3H1-type domain-containing protein n=1 Tax=Nepenthes gracilis TaxID=150966 RepID=A0AAD3XP10_NEPGR|nr:hypothetical protein Nepgr_013868 [Nepenthes gracilis]
MPDNRQSTGNAVRNYSNGTVENIKDGVRGMKIEDDDSNQDRDMVQRAVYPYRPSEPDCMYYLRTGSCGYGSNCRFNHPAHPPKTARNKGELPQRVDQPDCGYYLKTGTCKYGSSCKYHHPRDRKRTGQVSLNALGLPMRQEEKPCPYYLRTFTCKFGPVCKFHHPQPASVGSVSAVPGPASLGSTGSSMLPSAGLLYAGGLSAWLLPGGPYTSGPGRAGAQTYMPFVLPPSQGFTQGWNTYMDSGEPGTFKQVNATASSIAHLPERPDQPECRYFMSTGSCKYGSDCKYHHPKDRISQLALNTLGPHGLPLRPGETICSYFNLYGICEYGPTCKFDHPIASYYSNLSFTVPSISVLDPSVSPYQRNLLNTNTSETSPSKLEITEWIQKPETSEDTSQNSDVKDPGDTQEQADNHPHSLPAS